MKCDYLIIGCGLFGSVMADRIANILNKKVIILEKRDHIAGNCYSEIDPISHVEIHKYGTHIFHTSSEKVWRYISSFSEFNNYHHQVLSVHNNRVYQMPINLETINSFYQMNLNPHEAKEFLENEIKKDHFDVCNNLEEKAISCIGRPLYEAFIKGYTEKQWGKHPKELPASIINRLPVRYNYQEDYFLDAHWQGIPKNGYTHMFNKILDSPNIKVLLNHDFFKYRNQIMVEEKTIYTGPIDRLFDFQYGHLEWRSIKLDKKVVEVGDFQGTAVMNYADKNVDFTRIHEFKHLHPERPYQKKSVICYERASSDCHNPSYPVNTEGNNKLYSRYKNLAEQEKDLIVGGRLGHYKYYDMDKTILAALSCFEKNILE